MSLKEGLAIDPGWARARSLSALPASALVSVRQSDPRRYAFPLGFAAMLLVFVMPASLLSHLGIEYKSPGGNLLIKIHPATYVAALGAWFALYGRSDGGGVIGLFRERTALAWSAVLFVFCAAYSLVSVGISGGAIYVETYLAAVLMAIALEAGTDHQRRVLGYTILSFALVNIALSVMEGMALTHLIPVDFGFDSKYLEIAEDFRGAGLYDHPLTGSLATSMALLLALGMHLRPWTAAAVVGVCVVGLMSFGGRGALFTTMLLIAAAAMFRIASGLVTRRLNLAFLTAFIAGSLLLPALFVVLTTMTDIGLRIVTRLYLDESADIRIMQWRALDFLQLRDVLFGMSLDRIDVLKAQIGLLEPGRDIENPWLLMFLNLGALGFPILIAALFLLLLHLGRRTNTPLGWMIVLVALLICSTSNSLGRKSPDLIFLAGFMVALSGFSPGQRVPLATPAAPPADPVRRTGLVSPTPGRLRTLTDRPVSLRHAMNR
jgi:polysaccharide biosynthesis protein VpsF